MKSAMKYVMFFEDVSIADVPKVGGKNASLGEMVRSFSGDVPVPAGFAVTADAYRYFLEAGGIAEQIRKQLAGLDTKNMAQLAARGRRVRELIMATPFPDDLRDEIVTAYRRLSKRYRQTATDVAVRSSATAEDLATASFAGQQESYLNVSGEYQLLESIKLCFTSLFTDRAISYRADQGFEHLAVALSAGVQKMVRSDLGASGVMFTIDTESGYPDAVIINGSWGLGENIVKGKVNPDEFIVHKPTLAKGFKPIIGRKLGSKATKLTYSVGGSATTRDVAVPAEDRKRFCLSDRDVLALARWGLQIEEHYGRPMDIEWAKDGRTGQLFIVQARPETVQSQRNQNLLEKYVLSETGPVLVSGAAVGAKIGQGKARMIKDVSGIAEFQPGEVLVTEMTDPDWEPIMKVASAIVTNSGGRTSHAAIVSRELGIPCLVGTGDATKKIRTGQPVTVSAAEGEVGHAYAGLLKFSVKRTNLKRIPRPRTQMMMNVADPDRVFELAQIPNDGVGLAREEFVVTEYIKIHPMALVHFNKVKDAADRRAIERLTAGYASKPRFFVDKLAEGIGRIAAAFYPKDVIVRMSDFKTNEYATLIGGRGFEPAEENPMIGWRGASRYYDPDYREGFRLECEAFKKVRDEMGLTNLKIMIPFCRTVEEGRKVLGELSKHGLKRGRNGLEVYVMAEIPSNVVLAEQFAELFDGFSIGSNDLTQLTLGVDRDSAKVAHVYDERNQAVKDLISQLITRARKSRTKVGICGQAPSDFPDFAEFLVKAGIDSISLDPDTVVATTVAVSRLERRLEKS